MSQKVTAQYLAEFTRREDALMKRVRELGIELPYRLTQWRVAIGDSQIYLNELKNLVERTEEKAGRPINATNTAPLRLDVLNEILACVDAEPEFPGEMPAEMNAALMQAMEERDIGLLVHALRLAVQMTKQGIRERILSHCGEVQQIQSYLWEHPNGTKIRWNITKAIELTKGRAPDTYIQPADVAQLLMRNDKWRQLDSFYAMGRDLSVPLIGTQAPCWDESEGVPEGVTPFILIDGWHRCLKAWLAQHTEPLTAYVLTPEEDAACRIDV